MSAARSDYFKARRLDYIDWRLAALGTLCRDDIAGVFGVSGSQASVDIRDFIALYPDAARYDRVLRRYVPAREPYLSRRNMDDPNIRRALTLLANAGSPMGWI